MEQVRGQQEPLPWQCELAGGLGILKPSVEAPVSLRVASETCEV